MYSIQGVSSDECPVSIITAESRWLVQQEAMNRRHKEACGACLFGQDSGQWPAVWADAVAVIESARISESKAEDAARSK